jgi:hypothetical protein
LAGEASRPLGGGAEHQNVSEVLLGSVTTDVCCKHTGFSGAFYDWKRG